MRFKLLEDGQEYDEDWKKSDSEVSDLVSSFWVFPDDDVQYYPLANGNLIVIYI